jgi:aryl-alcohol dehydrogenase-like predicted oxidoreductase
VLGPHLRYIGCSNYAAWQLMKALWIADRKTITPFVSNQLHYSLQARDIENELVPLAIDQCIGILVWSPIAGGLLSGKYRRDVAAPAGSRHLTEWNEPPVYDEDQLYDIIEELVAIGEDLGVSAAQAALAYTMAKPAVTSLIVGARTEEQLADNLAAADLALPAHHAERLDKVSAQPLPFPLWHQARNASERFGTADLTLLPRLARDRSLTPQ